LERASAFLSFSLIWLIFLPEKPALAQPLRASRPGRCTAGRVDRRNVQGIEDDRFDSGTVPGRGMGFPATHGFPPVPTQFTDLIYRGQPNE